MTSTYTVWLTSAYNPALGKSHAFGLQWDWHSQAKPTHLYTVKHNKAGWDWGHGSVEKLLAVK